ncbi:MAG: hypothetical protein KDK62_01635 [Chlamydiia bacterium]|nr:hypothetical protein [Chlamydiia bacterium]
MKTHDNFKIFIDRLKNGVTENIAFLEDPSFLDVHERELGFFEPIQVMGEAYLIQKELVIKLTLKTKAELPCSICNKKTSFQIDVDNFYLTKPLDEIPTHIFDYSEEAREAILLEVPFVVECSQGICPERKEIEPYLAPPTSEEEGWRPFKDL